MTDIALRCYVDTPEENHSKAKRQHRSPYTLVFDTETTADETQDLTFGSCGVWYKDHQEAFYLFYNDQLSPDKIGVIKKYGEEHSISVLPRSEFVEKVFIEYVYKARAACVGFNLPFDLPRLAIDVTESRKYKNGFSLKLSEKPWIPAIAIKHLDSKRSFIQFTTPLRKKSERKNKGYMGYFLDLKTLLFALTDQSYDLANALIDFQCKHRKIEAEEHGIVTPEYIDYNINDNQATYELYEKALERYSLYGLDKEPNGLYSPASIGKAYLGKIGIRSFDDKNPGFPKDVKGYLMSAYYGGRVEVRIRKQPVRVSYIDFTSMYPSLYVLLGLDRILKAEHIECVYNARDVQEFLNNVEMEDIPVKETWNKMLCICRLKPDNDILPVRSRFGNKNVLNIGLCCIDESRVSLWYALPDVVAAKMESGKTPVIEEAIMFRPIGVQSGLQGIEALKGVHLAPDEDFIKKLIEERNRLKKDMKKAKGDEEKQLDLKQFIYKIIANSTSYGIFIEVNTSEVEEQKVNVYGLKSFTCKATRTEEPGKAYNPIMAATITAGARLILATAEALTLKNGGYYAYCDTDSIFISPDHVKQVQAFFKPLNPYNTDDLDMFKIEDEHGQQLDNILFYGISDKRYALYIIEEGEIRILKYSSHGLGENLLGLDQEEFWRDILTIHYHPDQKSKIMEKYAYRHAIYNFKVSSYNVWQRFKILNYNKPYSRQIKPSSFFLIGMGYRKNPDTKEFIMPIRPYTSLKDKKFKEIVYGPFVDYKTGEQYPNDRSMDTREYWKPLSKLLEDYIDHPESKLEGDTGILQRKHIVIDESSIHYIGKETNGLDDKQTTGVDDDSYTIYENTEAINNSINDRIMNMSEAEALELGINPLSLSRAKARIRKTGNAGRSQIIKQLQTIRPNKRNVL